MAACTVRVLSLVAALLALAAPWARAQHDLAPEEEARTPDDWEELDYAAAQPVSEPGELLESLGSPGSPASGARGAPGKPSPGELGAEDAKSKAPSRGDAEAGDPVSLLDMLRQFRMEVLGAVTLLVYLATWVYGKAKNLAIVAAWEEACMEVLQQNFAAPGNSRMEQEGLSSFRLLARGRAHCSSCSVHLDLAKRQDALSAHLLFAFMPFVDVCRMEIPMDTLDNLTFCICRKRDLKSVHSSSADLRDFARPRKVEELQDTQLCVLADSMEVVHAILQPAVVKVLRACGDWVQMLHISDIMAGAAGGRKSISASFLFPTKLDQMDGMASLVRLTLYLIDVVAAFKLSEKTRKQVTDARRAAQKVNEADKRVAQEQRMQQKKLEKRKQEEGSAAAMSKEALRKREEKEYKKSLKSKMPRMKMTRS